MLPDLLAPAPQAALKIQVTGQYRALLLALIRGEHVITGFRHLGVQRQLPRLSSALGRRAIITALKLRELFVLPQLASNTP